MTLAELMNGLSGDEEAGGDLRRPDEVVCVDQAPHPGRNLGGLFTRCGGVTTAVVTLCHCRAALGGRSHRPEPANHTDVTVIGARFSCTQ